MDAERQALKDAVKASLARLQEVAPGRAVEVRIPPFAAVQAVAGHTHRRGTPSAVVETDPQTWLALASGELTWADAVSSGRLHASGERSDLSPWLPLTVDRQPREP
jgi:hypothetical protein